MCTASPPPAISTAWFTANPHAAAFRISTAADLAGLAQLVNVDGVSFKGKTITLARNINLSGYDSTFNDGKGWIPIGGIDLVFYHNGRNTFQGVFDGNGKTVRGLFINDTVTARHFGLFGAVTGGTVKNLRILDVDIRGNHGYTGGVAGMVGRGPTLNNIEAGSIINCYVTGTVNSVSGDVGGIAGAVFFGKIEKSRFEGAVSGRNYVGGIVGYIGYSLSLPFGGPIDLSALTVDTAPLVLNSAALNPSVIWDETNRSGRAVGLINTHRGHVSFLPEGGKDDLVHSRVAGLAAFGGMKVTCIDSNNIGANTKNGASVTIAEVRADGTIGGRFTSENGWTTQNGKLPGLFGNTVDIPKHHTSRPDTCKNKSLEGVRSCDSILRVVADNIQKQREKEHAAYLKNLRKAPEMIMKFMAEKYLNDSSWFLSHKRLGFYDEAMQFKDVRVGRMLQVYRIRRASLNEHPNTVPLSKIIEPTGMWEVLITANNKPIHKVEVYITAEGVRRGRRMLPSAESGGVLTGWPESLLKTYPESSGINPVFVVSDFPEDRFLYFEQKGPRRIYFIGSRGSIRSDALKALLPGSMKTLNDSRILMEYWRTHDLKK